MITRPLQFGVGVLLIWLYRLITSLAPVWMLRRLLQLRLSRGKETLQSISQKLMMGEPEFQRSEKPLVWGHAVGLGESITLTGLFRLLEKNLPDVQFLITTSTIKSFDAINRQGLPNRCALLYAPVDSPRLVRDFIVATRPIAVIWCEMDLWPNTLLECKRLKLPCFAVNANIGRSNRGIGFLKGCLFVSLLGDFRKIFCQNKKTRQALSKLIPHPEKFGLVCNIKSLVPPLPYDSITLDELRRVFRGRTLWVAASIHPEEIDFVFEAHARVCARHRDALMILVPRFVDQIVAPTVASSERVCRRSSLGQVGEATEVYIADTVGEMGLWYRLSSVVFLGGSICRSGGHNPYEAVSVGAHCVHGPHVWNFEEDFSLLEKCGSTTLVHMPHELADTVMDRTYTSTGESRPATEYPESVQMLSELSNEISACVSL